MFGQFHAFVAPYGYNAFIPALPGVVEQCPCKSSVIFNDQDDLIAAVYLFPVVRNGGRDKICNILLLPERRERFDNAVVSLRSYRGIKYIILLQDNGIFMQWNGECEYAAFAFFAL